MGFSTVAAQLLFFIAIIGISAGVIAVFSDYVDQTSGAMTDKKNFITSQLRTDIRVTNIDNSSGHLYIYVKNIGDETLNTDCVELFVDANWVNLGPALMVDPSTENPKTVWASEETLKLKPITAPLSDASVHEVKIVTCNGVSDSENF